MRKTFGRVTAAAALGVALLAVPATAYATPMPVDHQQTVVHANGTAKPDPDLFPYYYARYWGANSAEECVGRGIAGLGDNQWEVFYCWETSSTSTELWFGYGG